MSFLVVTLILVGSLIAKETMASVPDPRARSVGRVLDVVVVPLLVVFAATVALQAIPAPP